MADGSRSGDALQIATAEALHGLKEHAAALTDHVTKLTDYVAKLDARVEGALAVASIVDDNQDEAEMQRWTAAKKEVVANLYGAAQKYTTVVIAGAYVAYFTTFSTVAPRLNDGQLRIAAFLMIVSLSIFAVYEILSMAGMSVHIFKGTLEHERDTKWARRGWSLAMFGTLVTAVPAIWLSLASFTKGLGVRELLGAFFG